MSSRLHEFLPLIALAGGAVFLLAILLRSMKEASLPQGEALDPEDLRATGLSSESAAILREECGEPMIYEGMNARTALAVYPDPEAADATLARIQARLSGRAVAFLAQDGVSGGVPACLVALNETEPLEALRFMGTRRGPEIREKLAAWRAKHPFTLSGCGEDWVEIRFAAPFEDPAFFEEVAAFCPDLSAQAGGAAGLAARVAKESLLYMYWEPASTMRRLDR